MPFDGRFRHACFSHDFFARRKLAGFYKALTDKGLNSCTRRLPLNSLPSVRSLQFCKLRLRIVAITVFPALCGFLAASAAHRGQGFPLAARGFTWRARAAVGLALGLGDIPAHAPSHGLAVAHGWQHDAQGGRTEPPAPADPSGAGSARRTTRRCPDHSCTLAELVVQDGEQVVDPPVELLGLGAGPIEILPGNLPRFRGGLGKKHVQGGAVGHEKFRGKRAAQPYARQRQMSTQTATAADLVIADFERG